MDHPFYVDAMVSIADLHKELGQQEEADKWVCRITNLSNNLTISSRKQMEASCDEVREPMLGVEVVGVHFCRVVHGIHSCVATSPSRANALSRAATFLLRCTRSWLSWRYCSKKEYPSPSIPTMHLIYPIF